MKLFAGIGFFALFAIWVYLEFVTGTHESLKDALFWAAMALILFSGVEFKSARSPEE